MQPLMPEDRSGIADNMLRVARLDALPFVEPLAIVYSLGLSLEPGAPAGCEGYLDPESGIIRVSMRGTPSGLRARIAHELGHYAMEMCGVPAPHGELDAEDIAGRLLIPTAAIRAAARQMPIYKLPALWPNVRPETVLARAAQALGAVCVVFSHGRRLVYGDDETRMIESESVLRDAALHCDVPVRSEHAVAWQVERGVAIFAR